MVRIYTCILVFRVKRLSTRYIGYGISLVVIILISLQGYHAFQLYEKKSEEFDISINNVLTKVAIRHEKASDLERYTSFFGTDFGGQYKQALKQEFKNLLPVNDVVFIRDTVIYEDNRGVNYLHIIGETYDSITHLTTKHSVLARDIDEVSSLLRTTKRDETDDIDKSGIEKRVLANLFKKSKYISEMMNSAFQSFSLITPEERINLAFLDSIIVKTFEVENLDTKFSYIIYDEKNNIAEFPKYTDRYDTTIDIEKAKGVKLFPGNVFDETLMLYVFFPQKKINLLGEIWISILISIIVILFISRVLIVMQKSLKEGKRLAEAKNDFISNMTHEFKTPISTISLACEAMLDTDMNKSNLEAVAPFIKMIDEENNRLEGLVEEILKSAVIDKGRVKMIKEPLELNDIVATATSKANMRISNGKIVLDQAMGLLPFIGDPVHTNNIIVNLIDNAIKYSKEKVDILVKTEELPNGDYKLIIADKGIGIKSEHLDKIFDKLYRVPSGNVHNVKGYGLGLNYVKNIVDMQGWDISVDSVFKEGTTFTIIIKNNKENE